MIREGVPFGTTGEAMRFSVAGHLRASVRITADDAASGAIEIRRAWGGGAVAAYSPAETVQINGGEPVDLIVGDCTELVVWVTTAGSGFFDVEWTLDTPVEDQLHTAYASIGDEGILWQLPIESDRLDRVTIIAERDSANTKGVVQLRAAVDPEGQATSLGAITLDGNPTTFEIEPRSRLELYCSTGNAGLSVHFTIYLSQSPKRNGVDPLELPDDLAYLNVGQVFTAFQQFDNLNITGSGSGRTRIASAATAGEQVDLLALSGELPILIDLVPASGEFMVRQGSGGYTSRVLLWSDIESKYAGSSFPGSPSDGQPFYRTDLDMPELFHYDSTRGKWLGELRCWTFTRATAATSGSINLQVDGTVVTNAGRAVLTPAALTIVGAEVFNANTGISCDFDLYEGASKITTLISLSGAQTNHDHTLNQDLDADAGTPGKWLLADNITAGNLSNPIVKVYLRRHES